MVSLNESSNIIINDLIERYPSLEKVKKDIIKTTFTILNAVKNNKKILICGNGGSSSDSNHIVGELMKSFIFKRNIDNLFYEKLQKRFPDLADYYFNNLEGTIRSISLTSQTALMTAYANDKEPKLIFAQQVYGYGDEGDILLAISTSGNSENIVHAAKVAKVLDLKVLSLTGKSNSDLSKISDVTIKVPETKTYKVQELHLPIYHCLCMVLENEVFK